MLSEKISFINNINSPVSHRLTPLQDLFWQRQYGLNIFILSSFFSTSTCLLLHLQTDLLAITNQFWWSKSKLKVFSSSLLMKTSCLRLKLVELNFFVSFNADDQRKTYVSNVSKYKNSCAALFSYLVSLLGARWHNQCVVLTVRLVLSEYFFCCVLDSFSIERLYLIMRLTLKCGFRWNMTEGYLWNACIWSWNARISRISMKYVIEGPLPGTQGW